MVTTKHCCYGVCRNDLPYGDRKHMKDVTFMPFPKPHMDGAKLERWVRVFLKLTILVMAISPNTPTYARCILLVETAQLTITQMARWYILVLKTAAGGSTGGNGAWQARDDYK